jgi:Integrase core domain
MALRQMDVVGGVRLVDGSEAKIVSGIDDHSRFVVCTRVVARATARPVCEALERSLVRYGRPEQILTGNGKVFTARFGPGPGPVCSSGSPSSPHKPDRNLPEPTRTTASFARHSGFRTSPAGRRNSSALSFFVRAGLPGRAQSWP